MIKPLSGIAILGALFMWPCSIHAQSVEGLVLEGDKYLVAGDYRNAQKVFRKALRTNDENSEAHRGLGDAIYYQSRVTRKTIEEAHQHYRKALDLDSSNLNAQRGIAQCHLSFGEYDQAIAAAKAVLQADPTFADAQLTIAETYHRIARDSYYEEGVEKAREEYRKVLQIDPDHMQATHGLGVEFVRNKDYAQAIALWEKYITRHPDNSRMWSSLAWVYWLDQQFDKAVEYGQKALALDPKNKKAVSWIEKAKKSKAEKRQVLDLTNKILNDLKETGAPVESKMSRLILDGKTQEVIAAMTDRLAQDQKDGMAYFLLALASFVDGDIRGAWENSASANGYKYQNKYVKEYGELTFQYSSHLSPFIR